MASISLDRREEAAFADARAAAVPLADGLALLAPSSMQQGELAEQWRSLGRYAVEPNPFFESWFLRPAIEAMGSGQDIALACLFAGGRLVGLAPLVRMARYYGKPLPHLALWMHPNAFCGVPLAAKGHEQAYWRALLAHADTHAGRTLFLHLPELPADGPMADALRAVLAEQHRTANVVLEAERAMLCSDLSPEDYFTASMSGKKRKELRRQAKRLGEEGELAFARQRDEQGIGEWIDQFLALERAGWKGDRGSALASNRATEQFFRSALTNAAANKRLERLALTLDDRPIAMLANFLTPPGAYSFKTAFDETYSRYSPGVLLQRENLALLAREDIKWCDSCAAADHPMIERIWREKRRMTCTSIAIGGAMRRMIFSQLSRLEARGAPKGF